MDKNFPINSKHKSVDDLIALLAVNKEKQSLFLKVNEKLEQLCELGRIPGCCRKLRSGIWELKVEKVRIIYNLDNMGINFLYGYIKSTQKLPKFVFRNVQRQQYLLAC